MTDAIEKDSAPTNLVDDLGAAWDEQAETPSDDATEGTEAIAEEEVDDDATEEVEASDDAVEEEEAGEVEEPDEETEGLVAPEHWSKDDREMYDGLDDASKEFINRRYSSMEKDYHSKTQKAASSIKYSDEVKSLLDPFRERMQLAGIDDISALSKLVAAQNLLERDPKAGIEHLAKAYGVDLDEIDVGYDEVDPKIAALEAKIEQMESGMSSNSMAAQTANIEQFKDATDGNDNLLHPHFEEVYDDMVTLVKSKVATDLDGAYQKAIWSNESVRAKMLKQVDTDNKQARTAALAKKTAAAKRAAKTNVTGSGDAGADSGKELTLQQELAKNYDSM